MSNHGIIHIRKVNDSFRQRQGIVGVLSGLDEVPVTRLAEPVPVPEPTHLLPVPLVLGPVGARTPDLGPGPGPG